MGAGGPDHPPAPTARYVESKRSAIVTLVGILEERRALLKDQLGKDEGALFQIANLGLSVRREVAVMQW